MCSLLVVDGWQVDLLVVDGLQMVDWLQVRKIVELEL